MLLEAILRCKMILQSQIQAWIPVAGFQAALGLAQAHLNGPRVSAQKFIFPLNTCQNSICLSLLPKLPKAVKMAEFSWNLLELQSSGCQRQMRQTGAAIHEIRRLASLCVPLHCECSVLMAETKHTQQNKAQARFKLLLALHVQLQSEQKPRLETHKC